jgi:amino acid adenylation domain-containing protein/FkbH-like protein
MYILSSFTISPLQEPLKYLLKKFYPNTVTLDYANTNLTIKISELSQSKKGLFVIFFRLFDLLDLNEKTKVNFNENNEFINLIINLKKNKENQLIMVLCPSLYKNNINDHELRENCKKIKEYEQSFLDSMKENKIHTISHADIEAYYDLPVSKIVNQAEGETHIPYNFNYYIALGNLLVRKFHSITLPPYKVMIVDCDNTLWTGIAGDIGVKNVEFGEHNLALQQFLVAQKKQGVLICLCSKNEEETVDNVFSQRGKEMILKMSNIAIKKINRDTKSNNIEAILQELNFANAKNAIFIDDSEREIEEVRKNFQEILCVQMPQTHREFIKIWSFDIDEYRSITQTDRNRLELMQKAENLTQIFSNIEDPIERIKAKRERNPLTISKVENSQAAEIERIVQMPKKINQFNLFPLSYRSDEKIDIDIKRLIKTDKITCFIGTIENENKTASEKNQEVNSYSVQGDLTALAICKLNTDHLLVDGFFQSCRNTGLEIEYALIKHIAIYADAKQLNEIKIKFIKTEVNKLAETFIDILCDEYYKNSLIRFLLKHTKKTSQFHAFFKFVFKKTGLFPKDFDKKLNEEIIFEFPTRWLAQLDPYVLTRKTMEANKVNNNISSKRLLNKQDLSNAKLYLSELEKDTATLDPLVKRFSIKSKYQSIIEIIDLEAAPTNKSFDLETTTLAHLGLSSLDVVYLSTYINDKKNVEIKYYDLFNMSVKSLINHINKEKDKPNSIEKNPTVHEYDRGSLPLSLQERRIFAAEQSEGVVDSTRFHMLACFLAHELNIEQLKSAYERMIKYHDVFGFYYSIINDQIKKTILSPEKRKINFFHEKIIGEFKLEDKIKEKVKKSLTMHNSYELIRIFIFETDKKHYIFLHVHHCIFDAFSLNICLKTLSEFYNVESRSMPLKLTEPVSYQHFVDYQNTTDNDEFKSEASQFWSQHLSICENSVEIPPDKSNILKFKSITELKVDRYEFEISQQDSEALKSIASENGVTVYNVMISLFSILIANYSYNKVIPIITVASGREPKFSSTPGFFVNLLIHAFDLREKETLNEFFVKNHKNILNGIKFQNTPFSEIQKYFPYNADQTVAIVFQNNKDPEFVFNDQVAKLVMPKSIILDIREYCRFSPLTLFIQENQGKYRFVFEYAIDKYSKNYIKKISNNLCHTITNICKNRNQSVHKISVVCDEEKNKLFELSEGPKLIFDKNDSLVKRFQENVKKNPINSALCYNDTKLTYREVDSQSTQLALALHEKEVQQGDLVGIYLDPTHLFFIAELALLKIGAVFVPLSKQDPFERLNSIIENAKITFFILDSDKEKVFIENLKGKGRNLNCIDINEKPSNHNSNLPALNTSMEDAACILYTSGSTGTPKGVKLLQKGIFRVVESPNFVNVKVGDNVSQTANQAFDAAQLECWLAWNNGASLVIFSKETILDVESLRNKLSAERITHMWLTAGLFNLHANSHPNLFAALNYLIVGGDVVHKDAVSKVLSCEDAPTIINGYGPTETSIFALIHTFNKQELDKLATSPIGSPINNTKIQILTPWGNLAPFGAIGELLIAGMGVASYIDPELEKGRFIGALESREYLTGDLVQYHSESKQIMFVGRANEQQVKINGNLVLVEEIRRACLEHKAVKQAEVIIQKTKRTNRLIVFYTLNEEKFNNLTHKEWQAFLTQKLPSYMIPNNFIKISSFVINSNGKLDKKQFDKHLKEIAKINCNVEKLTGSYKIVLQQIRELIPNFPEDKEANLFNWGLNSLQTIGLVNTLNNKFFPNDLKFTPVHLRERPTIEQLTEYLTNSDTKLSRLYQFKEGDPDLPAIVFIHPAGGGISYYDKLIKHADFGNTCYGIEDPLILNNELKLCAMEAMAFDYLSIIKDEITGPFILAGYSFGGMLATEMAFQYERNPENKCLLLLEVILLDTREVSSASEEVKEKLKEKVLSYCEKQREKIRSKDKASDDDLMKNLEELCNHQQAIGFQYAIKKLLRIPVSIIVAKNLNDKLFSEIPPKPYHQEIFEVDASHEDMLENPDTNQVSLKFSTHIVDTINKKIRNQHNNVRACFFQNPLINKVENRQVSGLNQTP